LSDVTFDHGADRAGPAHCFQHVDSAHDVDLAGLARLAVRATDQRLSGQVEDDLRTVLVERFARPPRKVAHVGADLVDLLADPSLVVERGDVGTPEDRPMTCVSSAAARASATSP
jgi:hypothetical protein